MNYFITNKPLAMLEEYGHITWESFGFSASEISKAVSKGFQQPDGLRTVSILPIADEELLRSRIENQLGAVNEDGEYCNIITAAEAVAERDRLKAANDAIAEEQANIPTDDDIFKAQQLKLLTEINIKLGGGANV